jgi:hypothetical protein
MSATKFFQTSCVVGANKKVIDNNVKVLFTETTSAFFLAADTNSKTSPFRTTPDGKQWANEDVFVAPGAWRPIASEASSAIEHQLHIVQDRSRYNKSTQGPRATEPRRSLSTSVIDYPPTNGTYNDTVSSLVTGEAVLNNLSIPRSDNRKGVYLRTETRRSVDNSLSLKSNESSNFNWKQRLQLPATTRLVLSRILSAFNGSKDVNNSATPNAKVGNKPKLIRFVPLGLFSSMTRNAQNVSSHLHKILLNRLTNKTIVVKLSDNSTLTKGRKDNSSLTIGDEQFWSPIVLTSNEKSKNESLEKSSNIKNNSSKQLGGTKRYSILTNFGKTHDASNMTDLVYTNGSKSVGSNNTNKLKSNLPTESVSKAWLPILQPAKGNSKLLNYSILAEPENSTYSNATLMHDTYSKSLNATKHSRKHLYETEQSNNKPTGTMKSKLFDTNHDDSTLANTFVASNMQDLRIPNNEYPNKALEKVERDQHSSKTASVETKKWPGGTSGIESLDDLILYHTYTDGHKKKPKPTAWTPQVSPHRPTVTMHHQPGGGYVGVIKKPSVTIHNSHWDYEPSSTPPPEHSDYPSRPSKPGIVVLANRPLTPKPPSNHHYPNHRPTYESDYSSPESPSTTMYPVVLITPRPTTSHKPPTPVYHYPSSHGENDHSYVTTVHPSYQPSSKPSKCPNIIISTNGNLTAESKERCPDVNIMITSGVTNNNVVVSGSSSTTETSVTPLFDNTYEGTVTTKKPSIVSTAPLKPVTSIFSSVTSAVSSMLNPLQYPVWYFMLAPVMVIMAGGIGIAALLFPWAVGWRSYDRKGRLEKKALSYPHPKPRRRRSYCNADCFAEDFHEAVITFERTLNTVKFSNHSNDTFGTAARRERTTKNRRRKRNDLLINYYWWWLKSDT